MSTLSQLTFQEPFTLFAQWMGEAEQTEPNDPNAAALATATPDGRPSVRMVLIKRVDERGFCFFTNRDSRKGTQLEANAKAAICLHWKSQRRQVRAEGPIVPMPAADVDAYFHSRSRRSQIGAAVSEQSRPLPARQILEDKVRRFTEEHPAEIPRPDYWTGYCLQPERIEFWMDGPDRLHDRLLFTQEAGQWKTTLLYP